MAARRLLWYLDHHGIRYEHIPHDPTETSLGSADAAHVDPDRLAKAVLLEDERGYVLAVIPAARRLAMAMLDEALGRQLDLATEAELAEIFDDCSIGAVPAVGTAYGIPVAIDERLMHQPEVYLESGDHRELLRVNGIEFARLFAGALRGTFSDGGGGPIPPVRERSAREQRLDPERPHVVSLRAFGAGLRRQPEYEKDGHTGMLLLRTPEMRTLLEVARAETVLSSHIVHGPATLQVLQGFLDVRTPQGVLRVGEAEFAALPRHEQRELVAVTDCLFLLSLSPGHAPRPAGRMRRVLILANRTATSDQLVDAVRARVARGPCEFVLVCPVSPYLTTTTEVDGAESPAIQEAKIRLDRACERLRPLGARIVGHIGDHHPMRAIRWALAEDEFDEIIVSTLPLGASEWLRMDLPSRAARRFKLPVTHIVSPD
jgi:Ala-tRNA(Pro) deacylase